MRRFLSAASHDQPLAEQRELAAFPLLFFILLFCWKLFCYLKTLNGRRSSETKILL